MRIKGGFVSSMLERGIIKLSDNTMTVEKGLQYEHDVCVNGDHKLTGKQEIVVIADVFDNGTMLVGYSDDDPDQDHLCLKYFKIDDLVKLIKEKKVKISGWVNIFDDGENSDKEKALKELADKLGHVIKQNHNDTIMVESEEFFEEQKPENDKYYYDEEREKADRE